MCSPVNIPVLRATVVKDWQLAAKTRPSGDFTLKTPKLSAGAVKIARSEADLQIRWVRATLPWSSTGIATTSDGQSGLAQAPSSRRTALPELATREIKMLNVRARIRFAEQI